MVRSTNVVNDSPEILLEPDECTICRCDFSLEDEGGASGNLGIIPIIFCPTCHAGLHDMYTSQYGQSEDGDLILKPDKEQP